MAYAKDVGQFQVIWATPEEYMKKPLWSKQYSNKWQLAIKKLDEHNDQRHKSLTERNIASGSNSALSGGAITQAYKMAQRLPQGSLGASPLVASHLVPMHFLVANNRSSSHTTIPKCLNEAHKQVV